MPEEKEEGERDGEVGCKLGVRRGHAIAFAVHFYNLYISISALTYTRACFCVKFVEMKN